MKDFLKYICWSFGLIILLYLGGLIQLKLADYKHNTFQQMPELIFSFVFPIIVGVLIRLSIIIFKGDISSRWTINWSKLIGVGLPLLYIAMGPFLYYMTNTPTIHSLLPNFYLTNFSLGTISGVICGYIMIDSFRG